MTPDPEIHAFLLRHLKSIQENDLETYHATTSPELTLYEWWITPHRMEGLPFHDFMMAESARRGTAFGSESAQPGSSGFPTHTRFDLANLHIQHYQGCTIASYTLLVSSSDANGVKVVAHNETRVMVHQNGGWQVVHVHKSPAWSAPHMAP